MSGDPAAHSGNFPNLGIEGKTFGRVGNESNGGRLAAQEKRGIEVVEAEDAVVRGSTGRGA